MNRLSQKGVLMRGNSFGKLLTMTTFGESHGEALGVVIDGIPAGLNFDMAQLTAELARRAPGRLKGQTSRREADEPEILSGIFENKTLGTPITVIVRNHNQRSNDYTEFKELHRPGHADLTTELKFGHRDYRGGGRASGRETLARVIAGYFASLILPELKIKAYIKKMGPFETSQPLEDLDCELSGYGFPHHADDPAIEEFLLKLKAEGNSVGGKIAVQIENCPAALGEPVFDKLKADLGKALFSIGACTGIAFGLCEGFSQLDGKTISKDRNSFGGIEGGISNGLPLYLEAIFKAPSTVGEKAQQGRHDPCILPRVIPVVENMIRFVLADHTLRQRAYQ